MLSQVESEKIPKSIDETLGFDTMEKDVQFASKPAVVGGNASTVFGYGRQTDKHKVNILNYFHRVNEAIADILQGSMLRLSLRELNIYIQYIRMQTTILILLKTGLRLIFKTSIHRRSMKKSGQLSILYSKRHRNAILTITKSCLEKKNRLQRGDLDGSESEMIMVEGDLKFRSII